MSFDIFKKNMTSYMQNQEGVTTYQDFAKKLTMEYDMCVRRGYQTINSVIIQKANTEMMETMVVIACSIALQKQKGLHGVINDIGKGVVGYWTGATLNSFPAPIIPAIGSFLNIATVSAMVTNPGKFPEMGMQYPTMNIGVFLDALIMGMTMHLTTISGMYMTLSMYPGVPTTIAPGMLPWTGYTIPPAKPSVEVPAVATPEPELPETLYTLSPEQVESKKIEKAEADSIANDTTLPIEGRTSAKEYSSLLTEELASNMVNSVPVESTIPLEEIITDSSCEVGKKIVQMALKDVGIIEYGTPPGKNYGGIRGGIQKNQRGRIDDMFDNVGLDNQSKVRKTGSGYYWCAAAVSTWWKEAGVQIPSGGASCDNWMSWGKRNGYWSSTPKVGAAVLFGSVSDAHHIGIVASILPNGGIITIEGNTSGGGFDRNGCGVFQKKPRKYLGFVIPPACV